VTLADLLIDHALQLPGVEAASADDGALLWSRAGRPFAALSTDGTTAEFALDPAVATAAIRTPDVAASGRGPGWVAFRPSELDEHAADRAVAWFTSAHRRIGPRD
jgi:hypothetical protein